MTTLRSGDETRAVTRQRASTGTGGGSRRRPLASLGAWACAVLLAFACVRPALAQQEAWDPFEPANRAAFEFNDAWDRTVMRPVAEAYVQVVPSFLRGIVSNVFNNVEDLYTGINNLLQGKPRPAVDDFGRVVLNTFAGIGGLFDVATEAGIPRNQEDFGQTFGWWGAGPGAYLVIPFIGPSSARDFTGWVITVATDPLYFSDTGANVGVILTRFVDVRARLLGTEQLIEGAALDKYRFTRSAYLQRRRYLIYDGAPPPEKE